MRMQPIKELEVSIIGDPLDFISPEPLFRLVSKDVGCHDNPQQRTVNTEQRSTNMYRGPKVKFNKAMSNYNEYTDLITLDGEILNYTEGDHFDWHVDRKLSIPDDYKCQGVVCHIGTLVFVHFSPDAKGGQLLVRCDKVGQSEEDTILDMEQEIITPGATEAKWQSVFIPRGMPHRVKPLTGGTRTTVKFPVVYDYYREPDNDFPWHPSTSQHTYDMVRGPDQAYEQALKDGNTVAEA